MIFKKKKMNEQDYNDELLDNEIPVNDKRRFNDAGERIKLEDEKPQDPARSAREAELEAKLRAETERREAAESKLVGVQAKFEEAKAGLERETADLRTRMARTLEDRAKQGQFAFLTTLLPVLDNLNLAIEHSEKDPSLDHLRDGVKGTARSFEQALASVGVEQITSVGTEFNPELHEAVDMVGVDPEEDGMITKEYSRGYKFGDRLLRAARVQVGKAMTRSAGE
jgi:molecular chaperone GrpE